MSVTNLVFRGLFIESEDLRGNCQVHSLQDPLLFLGLTLSKRCNYHCRYCAQDGGQPASQELETEVLRDLIHQGKKLGIKSIVLAGAGEPLLDPAFATVVQTAASQRITTVLYSNGSLITADLARFLYAHDVCVCLKLDTLDAKKFNWLVDRDGAYEKTMKGLENLLHAGYCETQNLANGHILTRLAINAVVTRANLMDLPALALYCAEHGIKLFLDNLSLAGRAVSNWRDLITTPEQYIEVCERINAVLGYSYVGHSLDRTDACILWKYGIVIYLDGEARVCYDDPPEPRIGNIYEHSLIELVRLKQMLYPPQRSGGDCPLKCSLRERLWKKECTTLPPSEARIYFGDLVNTK